MRSRVRIRTHGSVGGREPTGSLRPDLWGQGCEERAPVGLGLDAVAPGGYWKQATAAKGSLNLHKKKLLYLLHQKFEVMK